MNAPVGPSIPQDSGPCQWATTATREKAQQFRAQRGTRSRSERENALKRPRLELDDCLLDLG